MVKPDLTTVLGDLSNCLVVCGISLGSAQGVQGSGVPRTQRRRSLQDPATVPLLYFRTDGGLTAGAHHYGCVTVRFVVRRDDHRDEFARARVSSLDHCQTLQGAVP